MWIEEKKLHEGAEAIVTSGYWLGKPAIKKFRRPRKWRHPELDSRLTKSRLTSEVRTLLKLQQLEINDVVPVVEDGGSIAQIQNSILKRMEPKEVKLPEEYL